jgi:predicted enzyme related to lactoylglutathione lyase
MSQPMKRMAYVAATAVAVLTWTTAGMGQVPAPAAPGQAQGAAAAGPAPAGDVVVSPGTWSPIVADLDKAIEFYGGVLGLTIPAPRGGEPGPRPFSGDSGVMSMFGMPTAQYRAVVPRVPGINLGIEIVELRGIDRRPVHPRPQDPGGTTLVLTVRDIEKAMIPIRRAGAPVATLGGEPAPTAPNRTNSTARGIIINDPDGHFVEVIQPDPIPETTALSESNIIGARVRLAIADTDQAARFYKEALRFDLNVGAQFTNISLLDLMGLKNIAQLRLTTVMLPGSALRFEMIELKGGSPTPVKPRLQDPGATRLQLRVKDLDAAIARLKAAGSTVVSTGGVPTTLQGGVRAAIMPDPNGLFLVLLQAQPPRPAAVQSR